MINVPNLLTIFRILMVPTYLVVLYSNLKYANQFAVVLFTVAALTDILDGHIARKYKLVTNFGKIIDPIADKIMVMAAMVALVELGRLDGWILVVMLFRDFFVDALRNMVAAKGVIIAAGAWGKAKTFLQIFAIGFIMFYDSLVIWPSVDFFSILPYGIAANVGQIAIPAFFIGNILIYMALAASVYSGIVYLRQYSKYLNSND
jgi:CDP-diacylglycerol--glycerol-3-phosphate 3-phosphatidyltransferase